MKPSPLLRLPGEKEARLLPPKLRIPLPTNVATTRWASDLIGTSGVVAFVTNAGFMDGITADGLRKCLHTEFSKIYVFHLRGNQRTSGEISRMEGGKIFESGSRAPIAISLFMKNKSSEDHAQLSGTM